MGSLNRAQQAYYLEKQLFSTDIPTLQIGISTDTANYTYVSNVSGSHALSTGNPKAQATRAFSGMVVLGGGTTTAYLCQTKVPGAFTATAVTPDPAGTDAAAVCAVGTSGTTLMEAIK